MPLAAGRRLPFTRLQSWQAVTTFSHEVRPPRERGTMWSKVRSAAGRSSPQYWHSKESRRNTLKRVKAGRRSRLTYCFSEITLGSFIRSEEHTSELQSLMRISYAVFCLKKKTQNDKNNHKNMPKA